MYNKRCLIYICPIANIYKAVQTQMYNENNKALFMSRFSLLGFYKRIIIDADSIKILPNEEIKCDDAYISFIYNGKYKCKLDKSLYSEEGWNLLKRELLANTR